jgi:hypothetical protein
VLEDKKALDERNKRITYLEENLKQISSTYQLMQDEGLKLTNQNAFLLKNIEDLSNERGQLLTANKTLNSQLFDLKRTLINNHTEGANPINVSIPTCFSQQGECILIPQPAAVSIRNTSNAA